MTVSELVKTCPECGCEFGPRRGKRSEFVNRIYCSRACQNGHRARLAVEKRGTGVCPECGREFQRPAPGQRFCSAACSSLANLAKAHPDSSAVGAVSRVKSCVECGKSFEKSRNVTWRQWRVRRFCSTRCSGRHCPPAPPKAEVEAPDGRWRHRAACEGASPGLFEPREPADLVLLTRTARMYCRECPVRVECNLDAVAAKTWGCGLRGGVYRWYKAGRVQSRDLLADDDAESVAS